MISGIKLASLSIIILTFFSWLSYIHFTASPISEIFGRYVSDDGPFPSQKG